MENNVAIVIADVARLLRRDFDARARELGITKPQWRVLSALRRLEGINQGGLADFLEVEPITVARMIDRMQGAQLVERRPDPMDRRTWRLFLTPKALDVIELLKPFAQSMLDEALNGFSQSEQTNLIATLDRIRSNLVRNQDDGPTGKAQYSPR